MHLDLLTDHHVPTAVSFVLLMLGQSCRLRKMRMHLCFLLNSSSCLQKLTDATLKGMGRDSWCSKYCAVDLVIIAEHHRPEVANIAGFVQLMPSKPPVPSEVQSVMNGC